MQLLKDITHTHTHTYIHICMHACSPIYKCTFALLIHAVENLSFKKKEDYTVTRPKPFSDTHTHTHTQIVVYLVSRWELTIFKRCLCFPLAEPNSSRVELGANTTRLILHSVTITWAHAASHEAGDPSDSREKHKSHVSVHKWTELLGLLLRYPTRAFFFLSAGPKWNHIIMHLFIGRVRDRERGGGQQEPQCRGSWCLDPAGRAGCKSCRPM